MRTILSEKKKLLGLYASLAFAIISTNAQATTAYATVARVTPSTLEVSSDVHTYDTLRIINGPELVTNVHIRPNSNMRVTAYDLSYTLSHNQPYSFATNTEIVTNHSRAEYITDYVGSVDILHYPRTKLNLFALNLCDSNAKHLRSTGQTDEQIFSTNHTIPVSINTRIDATLRELDGSGTNSFQNTTNTPNAFNIVCKANNQASNDRARHPGDRFEEFTLRTIPNPRECSVTLQVRMTLRNRASNRDIIYRIAFYNPNLGRPNRTQSRPYSIRANSQGHAYVNHQIFLNWDEAIQQGTFMLDVSQPYSIGGDDPRARYTMACNRDLPPPLGEGLDLSPNINLPSRNGIQNIDKGPNFRELTPFSTKHKSKLPNKVNKNKVEVPDRKPTPSIDLKKLSK